MTAAERLPQNATPADLVRAIWSASDATGPPDAFLNHALVATSCFCDHGDRRYYLALLREMLGLFRAERAYLFEVRVETDGAVEVCTCLASLDLDGDSVPQPEKKAPRQAILEAARNRVPVCRRLEDGDGDGERSARSLLVLPASSRERTLSTVVLENRFRELEISTDTARTALIYCRALAGYQDLAKVLAENESLWKDISRLREETEHSSGVPTVPATPKTAKPSRREGLKGDYSMIVGSSLKIFDILQVVDRISSSNAPVLINGESGTGKELVALAVHRNSPRRDKTFVSENCGAITETLLESELFGYVKGAFTGANKDHKGLFELAKGGTLFLDEVGDMSPSMQKKLLRVLQEGVIRRVGAKDFTPVDVRIISATNKDLLEGCRKGNFREDLYYRLNVINLVLPPLRERREDIPELVDHFLRAASPDGERVQRVDTQAMQLLVQYPWPGNVRELQNEVRKMAALCDADVLTVNDLSEHLRKSDSLTVAGTEWTTGFSHMTLKEATEHLERALIRHALDESGGNKSLVAKTLQIPKTSLYNKIHKYGL